MLPSAPAASFANRRLFRELGLEDCRLDPVEFSRHRLTEDERRQFIERGYLCVHDALPEDHHAALLALMEELQEQ